MDPKTLVLSTIILGLTCSQVQAQGCPTKGLIEPIGQGTPGTNGVPLLDTVGVPLQDKVLWFELTQGRPDGPGIIFGSLAQAGIPVPQFGATLYLAPPFFTQAFALDSEGESNALFELPSVPDLCGIEILAQAIVLDPLAMGAVAFSKAMRVRFGGPAEGLLFPGQAFPAGTSPRSVAIEDLNGDGVLDMAVVNWTEPFTGAPGDVSVLLGLGGGGFGPAQSFPAGDAPRALAVGDLDGDGVPDLAVANEGYPGHVSVLPGLGDGTFAAAQSFPAGSYSVSVAIGDLDGNGVPDLAVANYASHDVSVLLGLGGGAFASAQHVLAGGRSPEVVATSDLDGDGVLDLAVTMFAPAPHNGVWVLLGHGDGTFAAPQSVVPLGGYVLSLAIDDLDGDGVPDLAGVGWSSSVYVNLGLGDGTFSSAQSFPVGQAPYSVAIEDFDGDGIPDLAVANRDSSDVSVLLGLGSGMFAAAQSTLVGDGPLSLATGDLDGDGVADLAVANQDSDDVSVLLGLGDGSFAGAQSIPSGVSGSSVVATRDLDGDGVIDLAVTDRFSDAVSVLLGLGDGIFSTPQSYPAGESPTSIAIDDLDGNGVPDLAVTLASSFGDPGVSVLLGLGDGSFTAPQSFSTGYGSESLAIKDLDGDGVPDLAVANALSSNVSVLLGLGNGSFSPAQNWPVAYHPESVAIDDLDGDGVADLVLAGGSEWIGGGVSVLLGLGGGVFAPVQIIPTGEGRLGSVAIEDLNGDGVSDLAVADVADSSNGIPGGVWVHLGLGDGTFESAQLYPAGFSAYSVAIEDLDGDGVPDLAVTSDSGYFASGQTMVLLGVGDGTFAPGLTHPGGYYPQSITIDDLDEDGVPDLVWVSGELPGGSIWVLLNQLLK